MCPYQVVDVLVRGALIALPATEKASRRKTLTTATTATTGAGGTTPTSPSRNEDRRVSTAPRAGAGAGAGVGGTGALSRATARTGSIVAMPMLPAEFEGSMEVARALLEAYQVRA